MKPVARRLDACEPDEEPEQQKVTVPVDVLRDLRDHSTNIDTLYKAALANFAFVQGQNLQLQAKVHELEAKLQCAAERINNLEDEQKLLVFQTQAQALCGAADALGKRASEADVGGSHKRQKHSATDTEIYDAFVHSRPILGVEGWRFADKDAANSFWQTLVGLDVYRGVSSMELRMNSAKKTLNALGYSHDNASHPDGAILWSDSLTWRWDIKRALNNCYWLKTMFILDPDVKDKIKAVAKAWITLTDAPKTEDSAGPADAILQLTTDNVENRVKRLFVFAKEKSIKFEMRKMNEVVAICENLKLFWKQDKIGKMLHFVPKIDPDRVVLHKLVSGLLQ